MMEQGLLSEGSVIYVYTRAQAIEDGQLIDLSVLAPDVCCQHFKYPVACTAAVWRIIERAIENPRWCSDINGVVHDILWMSRCHARAVDESTRLFQVIIKGAGRKSLFTLKLVCGPGDGAEPVLTLMLPEED
jgi:hypothetical protein